MHSQYASPPRALSLSLTDTAHTAPSSSRVCIRRPLLPHCIHGTEVTLSLNQLQTRAHVTPSVLGRCPGAALLVRRAARGAVGHGRCARRGVSKKSSHRDGHFSNIKPHLIKYTVYRMASRVPAWRIPADEQTPAACLCQQPRVPAPHPYDLSCAEWRARTVRPRARRRCVACTSARSSACTCIAPRGTAAGNRWCTCMVRPCCMGGRSVARGTGSAAGGQRPSCPPERRRSRPIVRRSEQVAASPGRRTRRRIRCTNSMFLVRRNRCCRAT